MLKIESREAANLKSRVKDLSQVPNLVNYAGLFACITPLSKNAPVDDGSGNVLYEPVLIRDTNSLIAHFGDPRIDPEKYVDLYSIMQIVGDGTSCYVAKVSSGQPGVYPFDVCNTTISKKPTVDPATVYTYSALDDEPHIAAVYDETDATHLVEIPIVDKFSVDAPLVQECTVTVTPSAGKYDLVVTLKNALAPDHDLVVVNKLPMYGMRALSALDSAITINAWVTQAKPYSIKAYYLKVNVVNSGNILVTAKVKLDDSTTNQELVNGLTSLLSPYVVFELLDESHKNACALNDDRDYSIVKKILDLNAPLAGNPPVRTDLTAGDIVILKAQGNPEGEGPEFKVLLDNYIETLNQYKDKKYVGCLMADMVAPISHFYDDGSPTPAPADVPFGVPTPSERRTLHYWIKQIACERKDVNVILSVPLINNDNGIENDPQRYSGTTKFSIDDACEWVSSTGAEYSTLWEYGHTDTTDYAEQSFYLEMYFTWLTMNCVKLEDGIAKSAVVQVAPANIVAQNVLRSYRERGPHLPVAGDQYGALPSSYSVIVNPKTKAQRDQLVQYRINPIYDTGTRGVQIYGNETLNAGYTDLNAAHIARELVNIRSRIDEYTETLKFMLNNAVLWDTWKAYVSTNILDPAKSINAIKSYAVAMGYDTTTPEEMANRMVKGQVSLQFYQSAEIFDLTFTIFSTSAETLG